MVYTTKRILSLVLSGLRIVISRICYIKNIIDSSVNLLVYQQGHINCKVFFDNRCDQMKFQFPEYL